MNVQIHPTAIVHPDAQLSDNVTVGPFAFIGPHVKLGAGCVVEHHATVDGFTEMGEDNQIYPYAYIGAQTHDLKYKGGTCYLKIGARNIFREYVTIHTATQDGESTVIGNDNYGLAFSHIGHNCVVKNNVIISAQVAIGGHVVIGNHANIGGNSAIHQFCKVGDYAMLGGQSFLKKDLPPFILACGVPAYARTFNRVGMTRKGFSEEERSFVKSVFKCMYESNLNRSQALEIIMRETGKFKPIADMFINFIKESKIRGCV